MAMSVGSAEEEGASGFLKSIPRHSVDIMPGAADHLLDQVPCGGERGAVADPESGQSAHADLAQENITLSVWIRPGRSLERGPITDKQVLFQKIVAEARKTPQPEFFYS